MSIFRIAPDTIASQTELTGVVGDIQDDPDSPDGNWLTAPVNVTTTCRVSFGTPAVAPTGTQEFKVRIRETSTNNGQTTDGVSVFLYEGGTQVGSVLTTTTDIAGDPGEVRAAAREFVRGFLTSSLWDDALYAELTARDLPSRGENESESVEAEVDSVARRLLELPSVKDRNAPRLLRAVESSPLGTSS